MQFKSFVYIASVVSLAFGASVQDLLNSLSSLNTSVITLDNAINDFPANGGTLPEALEIHTDLTDTQSVIESVSTTVQAVTPQPVSDADGEVLLTAIYGIVPTIEDALTGLIAKKPAFQALPVGGLPGLVLQDLINLNASYSTLGSFCFGLSPPDLLDQVNAFETEVEDAFATAIAAYS